MIAQAPRKSSESPHMTSSVDFMGLFEILRRQRFVVVSIFAVCLALALGYLLLAKPLFTAESRILIDPLKAEVLSELRSADDLRFRSAMIGSQVEVIQSRDLAKAVLRTVGDADYLEAERQDDPVAQEEIINKTVDALKVERVGETYVISLRYVAGSPEKAAQYSNAFAQVYLSNEISALQDISGVALDSMKVRLAELRQQMTDARERVRDFQARNDLYEVGGLTISDDQLRSLNSKLSETKNSVAAAKAELEFSRRVVSENDVASAVAAALDNDVINNIRTNYLSSQKKLAELLRTLGSSHEAVKNMRHEVHEYERIVQDEMRRIMQNDENQYAIAMSRQNDLQSQLDALLEKRARNNAQKAELEGLENEAAVYEALFTGYLDKMQQTSERVALPITDSRIISNATPPAKKSHPKPLLVIAASLVLGTGLGLVVGMYRGLTNETICSATDAERTKFRFLGAFPFVRFVERRKTPRRVEKGDFRFASPVYSAAINDALSPQADTLRRIRAVLDAAYEENNRASGNSLLIGVVSCHAGEGKTTLAANIALTLAKGDRKAVLIDGDVKGSKIVDEMFVESPKGLGNLLFDEVDESVAVVTEARTGLAILTNLGKDPAETMTMYSKDNLKALLTKLRSKYQYIVVDLPPLTHSSDVFVLNEEIDRYVIVTEIGKTKLSELSNALDKNEIMEAKILGVVLNKVQA